MIADVHVAHNASTCIYLTLQCNTKSHQLQYVLTLGVGRVRQTYNALGGKQSCTVLDWLVTCRFWEHHWVWWTGPFVGALFAAKLYAKYVMPKDQLKELRDEVAAAS